MSEYYYTNELYHHGILGMKWGIRRFQPYPKGHKGGKYIGKEKKKRSIEEIKKTPTAKEVLEISDKLTTKELTEARNRLSALKGLNELAEYDKDIGYKSMDRVMKKVEGVKNWGKTGIEWYKLVMSALTVIGGAKVLKK